MQPMETTCTASKRDAADEAAAAAQEYVIDKGDDGDTVVDPMDLSECMEEAATGFRRSAKGSDHPGERRAYELLAEVCADVAEALDIAGLIARAHLAADARGGRRVSLAALEGELRRVVIGREAGAPGRRTSKRGAR